MKKYRYIAKTAPVYPPRFRRMPRGRIQRPDLAGLPQNPSAMQIFFWTAAGVLVIGGIIYKLR
jgi:hypothetical protein